ncbi:LacI family DNA-binding transcriptional regulator [Corynebacterium sp. H128]|uniref:LacI family DNA-binding transcriptional regulator n=1 Tax=unclassified Corynebacterium TaxID=2624378 RepID=UPI0030A6B789
MSSPSNLKDVAAAAGVSISTASRALADKPSISVTTRNRVREVAKELNYQPNVQARGLRNSRTKLIGLAIPTLNNPYFATMAATIQKCATQHGQTTLITTSDEDPVQFETAIHSLSQMRVDGMIVVPSEDCAELLRDTRDAGTPIVLIDRTVPETNLDAYVSDPLPGLRAALRTLQELGHTHIGFLSGPQSTSTGVARLAAFNAVCQELGLGDTEVYPGGYEVTQGIEGARELLSRGVTALIAGDSMMTFGALDYCYSTSIAVGTALAFVGFDDLFYMSLQPTPISVIDQDVVAMSTRAHAGLCELIDAKRPQPPPGDLATTFIPRATTCCGPHETSRR